MVLQTLIARVRDGLILATSIESPDEPEHHYVKYSSQAKLLFRKLHSPNTPQVQSITTGPFIFHYIIKGSICALCLCDQKFPRKTAFAFLEDVANEFLSQNSTRIDSVSRPYHFLEFESYLTQAKRNYVDRNRFAMSAVNDELQDVTRIMVSNIEDVIHRGEALYILESRASDLSTMSRKYREDARQLNRRSIIFKLFICLSIATILFIVIRFFYF